MTNDKANGLRTLLGRLNVEQAITLLDTLRDDAHPEIAIPFVLSSLNPTVFDALHNLQEAHNDFQESFARSVMVSPARN